MDADPFFVGEGDIDAARALVASADQAELFLYPGDQHYFADSSCRPTTRRRRRCCVQRVLDFLAARRLSRGAGGRRTRIRRSGTGCPTAAARPASEG